MAYLLDTNILSYILKKKIEINKKLEDVRRLGQNVFPGITLENWLQTE